MLLALTVTSSTSSSVSPRITGGAGVREKRLKAVLGSAGAPQILPGRDARVEKRGHEVPRVTQ